MVESLPCNLCGEAPGIPQPDKARFLDIHAPLGISQCASCGLLYLDPRPTVAELREMYETHPYYSAENATRGDARREFYHRRMARVEKWLPERGTMLGIGCLEGGYALQVAEARGWRVRGVEFSEILAHHARRELGLDVDVAEAWDLSVLGPQRYDLIYSHSLEHVLDARETIAACRARLKPNGLVVLDVPNQFHSLKDQLKAALVSTVPRCERWFHGEVKAEFHTYFFDPTTLRTLLTSEGFEIVGFRTYLPGHPVYLANPRGRWLQEMIYALGGLVERGPSMELVARLPG